MNATPDEGTLRQLAATIARASTAAEALDRAVEALARRPRYTWVGIYVVQGRDLVLGPWRGPQATEHTRIPIGQGICGAAAATGRTERVDDVTTDPRYLACFPSTRSELVVPIVADRRVVGEIDVDSDEPGAFTEEDERFLEAVAGLLAPHVQALAR